MDYYSYKPLVSLDRPLLITGVPGTDVTGITRMVGSFTGLGVLLTDRKLAHALEHHPDRLTAQDKHDERWSWEKRLLEAAFAGGPVLVAMGSHSLFRARALDWLKTRAHTVYVREPHERVLERVVQDIAKKPDKHWLLTRGEVVDPSRVLVELAQHDAVLQGCHQVFDAQRGASHGIARDLLERLDLSA